MISKIQKTQQNYITKSKIYSSEIFLIKDLLLLVYIFLLLLQLLLLLQHYCYNISYLLQIS